MSLDVTLYRKNPDHEIWVVNKARSIAEAGEMKGLIPIIESYYNDREPSEREEVFSSNITHNLCGMAEAAGIYKHCWRPEEIGVLIAGDLIEPLSKAIELLKSDPERFRRYNASNGWGKYEHFIPWLQGYLDACKTYPDAFISVSR
jgi:hypothetical protein